MFFYTLLLVFLTRFRSPPGFLPKAVFIISNFDIAQRYLHDICTHFSSGGNSQGAATILSTAILLTFIFFFYCNWAAAAAVFWNFIVSHYYSLDVLIITLFPLRWCCAVLCCVEPLFFTRCGTWHAPCALCTVLFLFSDARWTCFEIWIKSRRF